MSAKSVMVVDDNDDFRQSVSWMLSCMGHSVRDFRDPTNALKSLLSGGKCDCLLLDVRMPEMSGLDVHDQLLERDLGIPVVYMTGHGDVALAVEAMKKGAITFLEKPLIDQALQAALTKSFEVMVRTRCNTLDEDKVNQFRNDLQRLTPREIEIMHAIVDGKANKVTALDLGISVKTVELHRSRVMKKLPVRSAQELVKMTMLSQ